MMTDTCKCHSGVKKGLEDAEQDILELFKIAKARTPLWAFMLLASMVISSLGIQWATYVKIEETMSKIAVIEHRMTSMEKQVCLIGDKK